MFIRLGLLENLSIPPTDGEARPDGGNDGTGTEDDPGVVRMDWFRVSPVVEGVYRFAEPLGLADRSWEVSWVNSYLMVGCERAALIDTGLGFVPIRPLVESITHLPVIVLNTHSHWDHRGGDSEFEQVAIHGAEAQWLLDRPDLDAFRRTLSRPGARPFLPKGFDPAAYEVKPKKATLLLGGGETVDLGGRRLRCLPVPGHSPGGLCFFEEETGLLFTGDNAYAGTMWLQTPDAEPARLATGLRRLLAMDPSPRLLLPGHEEAPVGAGLLTDIEAGLNAALDGRGRSRRTRLGRRFDFGRFSILLA